MIHVCQIHCHSLDFDKAELIGIQDKGKWLPFAFHMDIVLACKMTSDDPSEMTADCTTIFVDSGDTYIIDTPYNKFVRLFQEHHGFKNPEQSPEL